MANPLVPEQGKGRLSEDDVARFTEQIADLTSAGLPLAPGLRAAGDELPRGRLRSTLESVAGAIDRGATVDEALAAQGARLPEHVRGLIAVGSRTGKIGQVLGRYVAYNNVGAELRRKLTFSLAYPVLSFVISVAVFTFICSAIVPSFENIFRDFGVSLPALTILLIEISHVFAVTWQFWVEALIGLFVFWLLLRFVLNGPSRRTLLGRLPVVGFVWRNTSLAEFCHLLALLLECEVPLAEALRFTASGVNDSAIDEASSRMVRDVEGGMTLSESITRYEVFPKGLSRIVAWAEKAQSLPATLHMAGEMYEAGASVQCGLAGTVLAVMVITSIVLGIGLVVIGLFLPLINLISRLSG
jgi:general secretion pathway protein F